MKEPTYSSEIAALEKKEMLTIDEFKTLGHFRLQQNICNAKVAC